MRTGYFISGKNRATKVHLVDANHNPICGCKVNTTTFQRCANYANIIYVSCQKCVNKWQKLQEKE